MNLFTAVALCEGFEDAASEEELPGLQQVLIDSGYAWAPQGRFGRMAADLIRSGRCQPPGPHEAHEAQEAPSDT